MASKRGYLSQAELAQYADITITDTTEADDQISQAEEMIDAYIGFQPKAVINTLNGRASAGTSTSITLESRHQNIYDQDYFIYCIAEIIGGTGSGQRNRITASTKAGVLTTETFSTAPDSTSIYQIYQLGKFPRLCDEYYDSINSPYRYYRQIPEAVKRATAAQVAYIINQGPDFFNSDATGIVREKILNTEYERAQIEPLISPKAILLLRGLVNRKGVFAPEDNAGGGYK